MITSRNKFIWYPVFCICLNSYVTFFYWLLIIVADCAIVNLQPWGKDLLGILEIYCGEWREVVESKRRGSGEKGERGERKRAHGDCTMLCRYVRGYKERRNKGRTHITFSLNVFIVSILVSYLSMPPPLHYLPSPSNSLSGPISHCFNFSNLSNHGGIRKRFEIERKSQSEKNCSSQVCSILITTQEMIWYSLFSEVEPSMVRMWFQRNKSAARFVQSSLPTHSDLQSISFL